MITKQIDWQETDISDGQESPYLYQLKRLIAKTGKYLRTGSLKSMALNSAWAAYHSFLRWFFTNLPPHTLLQNTLFVIGASKMGWSWIFLNISLFSAWHVLKFFLLSYCFGSLFLLSVVVIVANFDFLDHLTYQCATNLLLLWIFLSLTFISHHF